MASIAGAAMALPSCSVDVRLIAMRPCAMPCCSATSAPEYSFGSRSTTSGRQSSNAARIRGRCAVVLSLPKMSRTTTSFASSGGSSGTPPQIGPSSSSGGGSRRQNRKPAASAGSASSDGPANITSWPARSNARANGTSGLKCPAPRVDEKRARTRAV
jgi:hypothetical protein